MTHLISITTGNPIPCEVIKRSRWRKVLLMPSVQVLRLSEGLGRPTAPRINWFYPSEVKP